MSRLLDRVFSVLSDLNPPDVSPGAGHVFAAVRYPGSTFHRLGKDAHGHVAILLALDPDRQDGPMSPVVLDNLTILHAVTCRVSDTTGSVESGLYTVVSCTSDDKVLIRHFVTLMSSLVHSLVERPSCQTAAAAMQQIIRLFRALRRPSSRSIQGLWGEIFVVRMAADARALVRAWREDPLEQFDFTAGDDRLEVKSTKWSRRSHLFSMAQLRPQSGNQVVVASVQVVATTNGLTLRQLWHDVRASMGEDGRLMLKVDQIVTSSLGRAWRRGLDAGFDESMARATLAFFDAHSIPSVEQPLSDGISEVRFRSDVSGVLALSGDEMRLRGPLFEGALPTTY
jgi:hypothetical protein